MLEERTLGCLLTRWACDGYRGRLLAELVAKAWQF